MILKTWDELPENMKVEAIKKYYDVLNKKKLSLFFKRIFDFVLALILLIILLPLYIILAILIKIDSPGPVFYRQERITQYGKKFKIYKFRTMISDADKIGYSVTLNGDNRVTRVGKVLRKYRLDETSQLLDVLRGTMSFVGTRPEAVKYVEQYNDEMKATLLLPAGITSVASIYYKDEAELLVDSRQPEETYVNDILPEKMKYNLESIMNYSFWNDIVIMLKTVYMVIK